MIPHIEDSKNELNDYEIKAKEIPWYHRVVLDRPSKVLFILLLIAIAAPLLLYAYIFYPSGESDPRGLSIGSCLVPRSARIPCGNVVNYRSECHSQCCFDDVSNFCFHRFPSRFSYILNVSWPQDDILRPRVQTVPFNFTPSFQELKLSVDEITPTHMSLLIYNSEQTIGGRTLEDKLYTHDISGPELNIMVNDSLGNIMFNTMRGPLIASENIWEISFKLTEEFMYGLGEIPLRENTTKVLYNHGTGTYGIPLIFSKTNDTFHGLLIDVVEPTEVKILGDNFIVVRSIAKNGLKFHLFVGPKPKDIMKDVRKFLGFENKFQYWMLGAHICSENKTTAEFQRDRKEALRNFLQEASEEKLPYESHCGNGPIVFDNNQCEDGLENDIGMAASLVRNAYKKFVPRVVPFIYYTEPNITETNSTEVVDSSEIDHIDQHKLYDVQSEEQNSNEKDNETCSDVIPDFEYMMLTQNGSLYKGLVENSFVIYPDYESVDAKELIIKLWRDIKVDGMMLADSWPLDESYKMHNETNNILPYFNENFQNSFNHTPQWNISRPNGEMYFYTHNQYGNHFANAVRDVSQEDIPIWMSSQRFNGDIVSKQHLNTTWLNLQNELTDAALGGISGHWLWASPVCGDTEIYNNVTNVELCIKWYMAAAYFPLVNIHSKIVRRDPLSFGGTDKRNIVTALNQRLRLLPYFYTTLQEGPLLRPMFYQFPSSESLINLRSQFSVGEDLLIVPNLQPGQIRVNVVLPPGAWYEFWGGLLLEGEEGDIVPMTTSQADFLTLVRAGGIVVMNRNAHETADETRLSDYSLTIALECVKITENENNSTEITTEDPFSLVENIHTFSAAEINNATICLAKGTLFMNENMTIIFEANHKILKIKTEGDDFDAFCATDENKVQKTQSWAQKVSELNIFGLNTELNNYDHHRRVLTSLDLCELRDEEEILFNFIT